MNLNDIKKGDLVNFDMIIPGIFGDQYKSVWVAGVVDHTSASIIDPEINVKHENFFPQFKESVGNVNDPTIYDYLLIKPDPTTNNLLAIGYPWIRPDSLEITKGRTAEILIQNWEARWEAPVNDFLKNLGASYVLSVSDKK